MEEILMSFTPEACELLADKQTLSIRKSKPKSDGPFKVYVYCTKKSYRIFGNSKIFITDKLNLSKSPKDFERTSGTFLWNGKIIGEFICNEIYYRNCDIHDYDTITLEELSELSYLSEDEILKKADRGYIWGWEISNLKFYDKPLDLSEFCVPESYKSSTQRKQIIYKRGLTPPRSWCYVEKKGA